MNVGLLFIPTLTGYWFLKHLYYTRYHTLRESGYHVLFKSAIAGCVFFGVSRLIVVFVCDCLSFFGETGMGVFLYRCFFYIFELEIADFLDRCFSYIAKTENSSIPDDHYVTVTLSVLFGVVLPVVINQFYGKEKAMRRATIDSGNLIEQLIRDNNGSKNLVELSLRSGKSYIGFALASGIARHGEPDIALIPLQSGYRKSDTHELEITTNYAPVILRSFTEQEERQETSSDLEDFRIVIPMSEIVSARIFDPEVYENLHQKIIL